MMTMTTMTTMTIMGWGVFSGGESVMGWERWNF